MTEFICEKCKNKVSAEPDANGCFLCPVCGESLSVDNLPEDILAPGTMIGGFEVEHLIACGGMGNIYLARQLSMERDVALKILRKSFVGNPESAERFLAEARTTAKFQNAHVVPVIDAGLADGFCYIAMQYVEGETIEACLNRGSLFPQDRALQICISVAEALSSIWKKFGMFHKDIKPANIILSNGDEPMILDMGIAQHSGASLLANGEIEGSPFYMSPEQAQGNSLTWSTDLYSLGITLYNMLTGVLPYEDQDMRKIMEMHVSAPFPEPETKVPGLLLIPEIKALLRKMMEKDPAERFDSWESFIDAAKSVLNRFRERENASSNTDTMKISPAEVMQKEPEIVVRKDTLSWKKLSLLLAGTVILAALIAAGLCFYRALQGNDRIARDYVIRLTSMAASGNPDLAVMKETLEAAEKVCEKKGVRPSVRNTVRNIRANMEKYEKELQSEKELVQKFTAAGKQNKAAAEKEIQESLRRVSQKQFAEKTLKDLLVQLKNFQQELNDFRPILAENRKLQKDWKLENRKQMEAVEKQYNAEIREKQQFLKEKKPAVKPPEKKKTVPAAKQTPVKKTVPATKQAPAKKTVPAAKKVPEKKPVSAAKKIPVKTITKAEVKNTVPAGDQQIKEALLLNAMILLRNGSADEMKQLFSDVTGKFSPAMEQWLREIREPAEQAAMLMKVLYHSRNTFRGAYIYSAKYGKKMKIGAIRKNEVYLLTAGTEETDRIPFHMIPMDDWYDLLALAAKKYRLQRNLPAFYCFFGDFGFPFKGNSPVLKRELPGMKKLFFRYISGETIPGVKPDQIKISPSMLRAFQNDRIYRAIRQKSGSMTGTNQKGSDK